jgi:hypothetical protein
MPMDFQKEKLLYTVRDIALMLGVGENAIRNHIFRKSGFLPEPIRATGSKKVCWGSSSKDISGP